MIAGTKFEKALTTRDPQLTDGQFRQLVFAFCQRYPDLFEQLEDAFAYLENAVYEDAETFRDELPAIQAEVELAMADYCESLNEVATALSRLLDETPFTTQDALTCISHVWKAQSLNHQNFETREDHDLCRLLFQVAGGEKESG